MKTEMLNKFKSKSKSKSKFKKGNDVFYIKDIMNPRLATIIQVHYDDYPHLYFTIQLHSDKKIIQTVEKYIMLKKIKKSNQ